VAGEEQREGGEEREDSAREGRLAPGRQRWRLQPGTICERAEALTQPGNPASPGSSERAAPGPRAPFLQAWRRSLLAAPGEGRERRGRRALPVPSPEYRLPIY
jgi:hypothetical protein